MSKSKKKRVPMPEEIMETAQEDLTKKLEDESIPVAREILRVIGEIQAECLLGDFNRLLTDQEKAEGMTGTDLAQKYYRNVVETKLMPILEKANIRTHYLKFILSLVMQPFDFLKGSLVETFEMAEDHAVAAKFGVKDQKEIRISDIIAAQKEELEKKGV